MSKRELRDLFSIERVFDSAGALRAGYWESLVVAEAGTDDVLLNCVVFSRSSMRSTSPFALEDASSRLERKPPPWAIGFSKQFRKDAAEMDRKLLGRVLEVLTELSSSKYPFEAHGDTLKRLFGDLDGCWRYRLGDFRLVLHPNVEECQLDAIALASRGSVYD